MTPSGGAECEPGARTNKADTPLNRRACVDSIITGPRIQTFSSSCCAQEEKKYNILQSDSCDKAVDEGSVIMYRLNGRMKDE